MKNFYDKINAIQELLPSDKRIKDRKLLATGIYFKLRMQLPFSKLPTSEVYSWSSFRHWIQRFAKLGLLQQIESIVGGES